MHSKRLVAVAGVALLGIVIGVRVLGGEKPAATFAPQVESEAIHASDTDAPEPRAVDRNETAPLPPPAPPLGVPAPPVNVRDEVALMEDLREIGPIVSPELSLKLAREGDARFPGSPAAAERGWFAVRALMELGRIDEAVAESKVMVEKYRGSSFANDVEKHMLTHPMTHPTEVGYVEPE